MSLKSVREEKISTRNQILEQNLEICREQMSTGNNLHPIQHLHKRPKSSLTIYISKSYECFNIFGNFRMLNLNHALPSSFLTSQFK